MKATLSLEHIDADSSDYLKTLNRSLNNLVSGFGDYFVGFKYNGPWVAEITGRHPKFKLSRQFLSSKRDYSKSNGRGSRGVYLWYILESGKLYQVDEMVSRRNRERYFCTVTPEGEIKIVGNEEVEEWLNTH